MNTQLGIEIVRQTHGEEVAQNMQQNPEDVEILSQIGNVFYKLAFLAACTLKESNGQILLYADGIAYHPHDATPTGESAAEIIRGNENSFKMELPTGVNRFEFARRFSSQPKETTP